nr:OmpA family protein [Shewanella amazonensis]
MNNYLAQFKNLNAEVLFQCEAEGCGDGWAMRDQLAPLITVDTSYPGAYVAAKLKGAGGDVYSSIYAFHREGSYTKVQLVTLEVIPEPLDLVEANSNFLQQGTQDVAMADRRSDDAQDSADHPLLGRMPGNYITRYKQTNLTQVPVIVGISAAGIQTQSLDARLTEIRYQMPERYSLFEINSNYAAAAQKLNAEQVFYCKGTGCGDDDALIKAMGLFQDDAEDQWQEYQLYRLSRPQGDVYFDIYSQGRYDATPGDTTLRVMELSVLKTDRIAINLDALNDAITQTGKATLDGLLFDFDSDRMLPESQPVLEVLATYLKQHPAKGFYVVGHTDDKGERAYNQSLSLRRADAVIQSLTQQYHIPASQLTAHGNGEYSPVASNENESGQALNRRVELVLRSDME